MGSAVLSVYAVGDHISPACSGTCSKAVCICTQYSLQSLSLWFLQGLIKSVLHTLSGVHWLWRGIHNGWGLCRGPGCQGNTNSSCCGSAKEHHDYSPSGRAHYPALSLACRGCSEQLSSCRVVSSQWHIALSISVGHHLASGQSGRTNKARVFSGSS